MIYRRLIFSGLLLAACNPGPPGGDDGAVGSAFIAVAEVPSEVACIQVTISDATRSVTQNFGVTAGQSTVLQLSNLPTGSDTFTGAAYGTTCSSVTGTSVPTWVGSPVVAMINSTTATSVTLVLKPNGQSNLTVDFQGDVVCTNLATTQTVYATAQKSSFLTQFSDAAVLNFNTRADGSTPIAGTAFPSTEYAAKGVVITVSSADATASLIWEGNATSGFGLEVTCSNSRLCNADIVVTFSTPQRAEGFDYPGNVEAIWKQPDGTVIEDTGDIAGSGNNFTGLSSTQPIGSVTLHRAGVNVIQGLEYSGCD